MKFILKKDYIDKGRIVAEAGSILEPVSNDSPQYYITTTNAAASQMVFQIEVIANNPEWFERIN